MNVRWWRRHVAIVKFRATRWIQPAGLGRPHPLRFRHGIAVRVPGRRVLVVTFGSGH